MAEQIVTHSGRGLLQHGKKHSGKEQNSFILSNVLVVKNVFSASLVQPPTLQKLESVKRWENIYVNMLIVIFRKWIGLWVKYNVPKK